MTRHDLKDKPQRSCLGCRETRDKASLIRFVLSPQYEVVPDLAGRLPGRGAYTCNSAECVSAAVKQRQFNRAFKREVTVQPADELNALIARQMHDHILGYLGLANRAGKIISGGSLVSDAIRGKVKPGLVLVARDVSETIGEKIEQLAGVHGIACARMLTKNDFGAILGKAPRSAVAVRAGGFVARIAEEINRCRNFLGEV